MTKQIEAARDWVRSKIEIIEGSEFLKLASIEYDFLKTILALLDREIEGGFTPIKCFRCNDTSKWGWSEAPDLYDCDCTPPKGE
jgi:hypothetical protein